MKSICGKVIVETMKKLPPSHQPSAVSLGFLEGASLTSEVTLKNVRQH